MILFFLMYIYRDVLSGFSGSSVVKIPSTSAEEVGSVPGLGRSPGVGNGNPFQCSYLENSMDREARQVIVPGVAKSHATEHST